MVIVDLTGRSTTSSILATSPERRDQIARRFKTFWPTSMRTATDVNRVHVLNVSRTGAKIYGQQPIDANQTLEVEIGDQWYGASVRWRRGETFGSRYPIMFYKPVCSPADCLMA